MQLAIEETWFSNSYKLCLPSKHWFFFEVKRLMEEKVIFGRTGNQWFRSLSPVLLVFKLWRTSYESVNYGISKLLIHIVIKSTPRFTKSPSLVLIRLIFTEIHVQQFKNLKINKEMYGNLDTVSDSVRMAIHFFINFDIFNWMAKSCLLLGLFTPNLGIL